MSSMWGKEICISIFGGSHTKAIGVTIDGLPAGETIDFDEILEQMARRAPGQDPTATRRVEADNPEILCGLLEGIITGAPMTAVIFNGDQRSKDYENLRKLPRPGHADYTAHVKYGGFHDIRGGGHFSGRLTAPLVFAGAVCRQILKRRGILIGAHACAIGSVQGERFDPVNIPSELLEQLSKEYFSVLSPELRGKMRAEIEAARMQADSVGGIVECAIVGLPVGMGAPIFEGVENRIASLVFGIPAVKGLEFGEGFDACRLRGSQHNDALHYENGQVKTRTNHAGGILGGISNGMPIIFRAAFKPTASIGLSQETVNLPEKRDDTLIIKGRHDPCIVPRAIPVVEAAAAVAVLDMLMQGGLLEGKQDG